VFLWQLKGNCPYDEKAVKSRAEMLARI
jgi:hypothetical protein